MNLLEEDIKSIEKEKGKKTSKIILIAIVLVFLIIIAIISYLYYIKSNVLKLTLNGQSNESLKELLIFENDEKIYIPIKEVAKYFEYESYNGEYNNPSEEQSKCYIQNENEIVNFSLGSTKIDIYNRNRNEYEYIYVEEPIKAINGVLYATPDTIEKAFNVSFQYNKESNSITILTMPYLIKYYEIKILDYGYVSLSNSFANEKAVLNNMLIVKKDNDKNKYAVIDVLGNVILEPKYDSILYLKNKDEFLVESNGKYGIISSNGQTKVQIIYNRIEMLDNDSGLYVVENDKNKYGVIDLNGNVKIYAENDDIGIDTSKFKDNNIKNQYLLLDNLIPVKKDKYWGLYDKKGNQIIEYEYDSFGYIASSNKDIYNLLIIPGYDVIVACKDKKYTLINSSGEKLFSPIADDIYMTITGGETHYYINVNNRQIDAEEYLKQKGITKAETTETKTNQEQSAKEQNNANQTEKNDTNENNTNKD